MSRAPAPDRVPYLTVDEIGDLFRVHPSTVRRRARTGEWPSSYLPGTRARRFSPADLAAIEARMLRTDDRRAS